MTSENPIGRKIVKGQNRSRGSALPRRYNRVPAQRVTYPEFGEGMAHGTQQLSQTGMAISQRGLLIALKLCRID